MTILNASSFLKSLDKVMMSPILGHIHATEVIRVIQELTFKSKGIFRCCQQILDNLLTSMAWTKLDHKVTRDVKTTDG